MTRLQTKGKIAPHILIAVNKETTILHFRLELVEALLRTGCRVTVAVPPGAHTDSIRATGAVIIETSMKKDAVTPLRDAALLVRYRQLIRAIQPDAILTYTVKPTVYAALAAGHVPVLATITGRGKALSKKGLLQAGLLWLYRVALHRAARVFFQNESDRAFFARHRIAMGRHETLPGSGVNLEQFAPVRYPEGMGADFAFISRFLPEKGLEEYIEVARRVRARHPEVRFHVAGFGAGSMERRMARLDGEGVILYHGQMDDVRPLIGAVGAVIHPSDYPEGLSNILMEASAMARPVITTDRAGCREAVEDGVTGYLIPPRNTDALEAAVERFLSLSPAEREAMGRAARHRMEAGFDRRMVTSRYLCALGEVLDRDALWAEGMKLRADKQSAALINN